MIAYLVFWLLLLWSLYDGDLDLREGAAFLGVWMALLLGVAILRAPQGWCVTATALLDVVLVLKVFGEDVQI